MRLGTLCLAARRNALHCTLVLASTYTSGPFAFWKPVLVGVIIMKNDARICSIGWYANMYHLYRPSLHLPRPRADVEMLGQDFSGSTSQNPFNHTFPPPNLDPHSLLDGRHDSHLDINADDGDDEDTESGPTAVVSMPSTVGMR